MLSFSVLWNNHPGPNSRPCNFENQCAIRMGIALAKSNVNLSSYKGAKCWFDEHKPRHILRAQELADWITRNPGYFGSREIFKDVTYEKFLGKKGIVFVKDGWGATDHIDIWDGTNMKGGHSDYFSKGREIWFWDLM